jgi:NTP pyrophosphatase (non-canonical NTP hydrolase)
MTHTIQELTAAMHTFVQSKGWYDPDSRRPQTLRNLAISLSLEANEVLEHFQWHDLTPENINADELGSELADVALYLLQLASLSEIDLEQAILDKLKVNYNRTWDEEERTSP